MHLTYIRFCSSCSPFPFILFIHLFAVLTLIDKASATSRTFAVGYVAIYILPTPDYTSASRELIYTDLYIDVVIRQDGSVFTKDHEVFDRAARRYPIVEESRQQAFAALDAVEEHAKRWRREPKPTPSSNSHPGQPAAGNAITAC